ncbi:MAG: DUF2721 domain-containing protein [Verrucomicrobiae bacterium]|nr:DUF2721 domain-containing protein [Verrucomicrobiae bacterium]
MKLTDLIPILQMAIGPVILISGVGLLLLSMTNRLGRVIDRSRILSEARQKTEGRGQAHILSQIGILIRRARLVRLSIALATLSLLTTALLVIVLFLAALFELEIALTVALLFVACMGFLIGSLIVFLRDINLALEALKLDLEGRE